VSRELQIGLGFGLITGVLLSIGVQPRIATAQGTTPITGLYQIQIATGLSQQGASEIWRINTATGALEFCTFTNVTMSGASHVTCQGSTSPR
jgi:hypothetical protein